MSIIDDVRGKLAEKKIQKWKKATLFFNFSLRSVVYTVKENFHRKNHCFGFHWLLFFWTNWGEIHPLEIFFLTTFHHFCSTFHNNVWTVVFYIFTNIVLLRQGVYFSVLFHNFTLISLHNLSTELNSLWEMLVFPVYKM